MSGRTSIRHWMDAILCEAAGYRYVGNCTVGECAPYLEDMMDRAKKVPYKELLRAVGRDTLADQFPEFYWGNRPNRLRGHMALHQDPYVFFYRSTYRGMPCYFVQESGIEHIFVSTEYDEVDWDDPERDQSVKRLYIEADGTVHTKLPRSPQVISVFIAGKRFKAIQHTALTPAVAAVLLNLIEQYKPDKIKDGDDEDDETSVADYTEWLRSI